MRGARAWIESHQTLTIIIGVVLFATVATAAMSEPTAAPQAGLPERGQAEAAKSGLSAADAMVQFKDLMDTAEKAELVSSYEFSDSERVIYVTDVWYSMTVAFKKDFLAKVAMLQEAISGRHFFEVREELVGRGRPEVGGHLVAHQVAVRSEVGSPLPQCQRVCLAAS